MPWMVRLTKVTHIPGRNVVYGIGGPTEHSPMGGLRMVARSIGGKWLVVTDVNFKEDAATTHEAAALEALSNDGTSEELMQVRRDAFERYTHKGLN